MSWKEIVIKQTEAKYHGVFSRFQGNSSFQQSLNAGLIQLAEGVQRDCIHSMGPNSFNEESDDLPGSAEIIKSTSTVVCCLFI